MMARSDHIQRKMVARSDHIQMVCDNYQLREDDSLNCGYKSKDHSFDQNIQNHFLADPRTGTVYCFIHKVAIMSVLPNSFIGPGGLRAPPVVADGSKSGHY